MVKNQSDISVPNYGITPLEIVPSRLVLIEQKILILIPSKPAKLSRRHWKITTSTTILLFNNWTKLQRLFPMHTLIVLNLVIYVSYLIKTLFLTSGLLRGIPLPPHPPITPSLFTSFSPWIKVDVGHATEFQLLKRDPHLAALCTHILDYSRKE